MATDHGRLERVYRSYVGEPAGSAEVYGYWLYLLAYVVGMAGFVIYLVGIQEYSELLFTVREVAAVLVGAGALFLLLGIVLQLPITRAAVALALLGLLVGLGALVGFTFVYPESWNRSGAGLSALVVLGYGVGFLMVSGVTALVPVVTGKKGRFTGSVSRAAAAVRPGGADEVVVEEAPERAEPSAEPEPEPEVEPDPSASAAPAGLDDGSGVFLGQTTEGATFALFRRDGEWTWWLVEHAAAADGGRQYADEAGVRGAVANVREKVADAGLLEIKGAAFRIYHEDDGWRWWLMREDGSVMAESTRRFDGREDAENAVGVVKEEGADASLVAIDEAAFSITESDGAWTWTLVDENRDVLAVDRRSYDTRSGADAAVGTVRDAVVEASLLDLRDGGFELFREDASEDGESPGERWRWRYVDAAADPTVEADPAYGSRDGAERAVASLKRSLDTPAITDGTVPTFELYADNDAWAWRLVDTTESLRAVAATDLDTIEDAESVVGTVRSSFATAPVFDLEDAVFEVHRADDGWRWRLVDTSRRTVATSTDRYDDREACEAAVEQVRDLVADADLLEFENAAFQLYEQAGQWRWRLVAEDGHVIADSGDEFTSRGDAASAIPRLKENVPNAELLEIENAAFELYREDQQWRWRLIDETGANLATSGEAHPSRPAARTSLASIRDHGPTAPVQTVEDPFVQVFPTAEAWHWRFVDTDGSVLAREADPFAGRDAAHAGVADVVELVPDAVGHVVGDAFVQIDRRGDRWLWRIRDRSRDVLAATTRTWDGRDAARTNAEAFVDAADDAPVFDLESPAFRLDADDDGWRWRLVTADRTVLAESPSALDGRSEAGSAVRRTRRLAAEASSLELGRVSYELVEADGGWRWYLVDDDDVVARDAEPRATREAAERAMETTRDVVGQASLLEFETAAFELHEEGGTWHWRLIDEDGETLARSIADYESRREARTSLDAVKRHAPSAGEVVASGD
jgi:uncharacterized protein YegP (UPF0339 family)